MKTHPNRENLFVVLVTGGRDYDNHKHIMPVLDEIHRARRVDLLVHGGAPGADENAAMWAHWNDIQQAIFRVTPALWRNRGKGAGPQRNHLMLAVCRPNLVVAFPGGYGTNGCVRMAREAGLEIRDERRNGSENAS